MRLRGSTFVLTTHIPSYPSIALPFSENSRAPPSANDPQLEARPEGLLGHFSNALSRLRRLNPFPISLRNLFLIQHILSRPRERLDSVNVTEFVHKRDDVWRTPSHEQLEQAKLLRLLSALRSLPLIKNSPNELLIIISSRVR